MVFSTFAACSLREGPSDLDDDKSVLNLGVYEDGPGSYFVDSMIADFEEYYKDKSFEDGKVGVQVVKDNRKDEFGEMTITTTMSYYDNVLWFVANEQNDLLSNDLVIDLTDIMTENIYDENGDLAEKTGKPAVSSIVSNMYQENKDYINVDNHYYSVPWRMYFYGVTYDADLFNTKRLYTLANGTINGNAQDVKDGKCTLGPDGKAGTSDDGMPNTWNDFMKLMDAMVTKQVIPFTWSGLTDYQRRGLFRYIWSNYEGANDYALNFSYSGTDSQFGKIDSSNFTDLLAQEGRKAAIKVSKDLVSKSTYYSSLVNSNTYTSAQEEFARSVTSSDTKPIAMLLEGSFWEVESKSVFDDMANTNETLGYGKRDFRFLPVPNFKGTQGIVDQVKQDDDRVLDASGAHKSSICISKKSTAENYDVQVEIAKLFIQFIHQREQLANFSRDTGGCFRPFNFNVTPEELAAWPGVARSIKKFIDEGATIVTDFPASEYRRNNIDRYFEGAWDFRADIYYDPIAYFMKKPTQTVEQCFTEAHEKLMSEWKAS